MLKLKLKPDYRAKWFCKMFREIAVKAGADFKEAECIVESKYREIVVFKDTFDKYNKDFLPWKDFSKCVEVDVTNEEGKSLVGDGLYCVEQTVDKNIWIFSAQPVFAKDKKCPHCGSEEIESQKIRSGCATGIPPLNTLDEFYRCRNCNKNFFKKAGQ